MVQVMKANMNTKFKITSLKNLISCENLNIFCFFVSLWNKQVVMAQSIRQEAKKDGTTFAVKSKELNVIYLLNLLI